MNSRGFAVCIIAAASAAAIPVAAIAACDARSGPMTAALVELYTSEGCSSCPPADPQLSRLRQALDPAAEAVPLALHVGYWDYIGWKDPYAQAAFAERQNWLVHASRQRTVYMSQFFVGGAELRLGRGALRDKVRQLNALPAAGIITCGRALRRTARWHSMPKRQRPPKPGRPCCIWRSPRADSRRT